MSYSLKKFHGQRSVGSEDKVKTNGRTDGRAEAQTDVGDCITSLADVVDN